jgi:hypothetical protein
MVFTVDFEVSHNAVYRSLLPHNGFGQVRIELGFLYLQIHKKRGFGFSILENETMYDDIR